MVRENLVVWLDYENLHNHLLQITILCNTYWKMIE